MSQGDVVDETLDAGTAPRRELAAGSRLGKYRLDHVLGSGGMGVVWAAHDPDLERAVALKVLRYEQAGPELRQRLLREARAMAKLKHPNVLTVYEVGSEGDRDYIAMELVEGASLDAWIATKPARDDVWAVLIGAGRGLAAAHRAGLVHRDFKPHNVLRGSDGRVLVTDFGLARGHDVESGASAAPTLPAVPTSGLEATIDATPAPAAGAARAPSMSVETLTRTGALLGTPAYMAPEQFLGAASDPRTDQFAYCVSAWQLLTGERPFRGDTIEELRRAASGGVANAKADLPGAVRAVLARGLASDPEQRWPDMNALLAALERAKGSTRRRVQLAIGAVAVGAITLVAVKALHTSESPPPPPPPTPPAPPAVVAAGALCEKTPEQELGQAWADEARTKLRAKFAGSAGAELVIREVDAFAATWLADYRSACSGERSTRTFAKLGCLLAQRDTLKGIAAFIPNISPKEMTEVEMGGVLPRPQACDGANPVATPTSPEDPAVHDKILALRSKLIAAVFYGGKLLSQMPDLMKQAEAIGWEPLIAEVHKFWAIAAERSFEWEVMRDHFKLAFEIARRIHYDQLAADMAVSMLGAEEDAVSDPSDAKAFETLAAQARLAVKAAGDDPHFLAQIAEYEGKYADAHNRYDDAIAKFEEAKITELAIHNVRYATRLVAHEAMMLLRRDHPNDADLAWQRLTEAEHVAEAAGQSGDNLIGVRYTKSFVAQVRGDLAAAHAIADAGGGTQVAPKGAIAITGHVVDEHGKGVAGARVVAWTGALDGDAERAFYRPEFEGAVATTAADGAFTLHATRDCGIIAELADRRSQPRLVGTGALELALAPTRIVTKQVTSDDTLLTGVMAIVNYELGKGVTWRLFTPVARSREVRIAGIAPGAGTLRLANPLDANGPTRLLDFGPVDAAKPSWPAGPALDVVVRGMTNAQIFVFRDKQTPTTRAAVEAVFASSHEAIAHPALIVGTGDETTEGLAVYQRNDHHGVLLANRPGLVTACAVDGAPASPAVCKQLEVPRLVPKQRDGRGVYPTIAVVLQR